MYKLSPAQDDGLLFFRMAGEESVRRGAIGYLRADFGNDGSEFWTAWFDDRKNLKTHGFTQELKDVIDSLRFDGQEPPFASRRNLESFCYANPGKELTLRGRGYQIRTKDYSYYFRCFPRPGDYDIYMFAYDNRYLLPELAGKHELPVSCYSLLPSTGELIHIERGRYSYCRAYSSTLYPDINRAIADENNAHFGITRAQEEAMLAGSLFGWSVPAAKPWMYELDGTPRSIQPKQKEYEAR